jgi:hypothetical protein
LSIVDHNLSATTNSMAVFRVWTWRSCESSRLNFDHSWQDSFGIGSMEAKMLPQIESLEAAVKNVMSF